MNCGSLEHLIKFAHQTKILPKQNNSTKTKQNKKKVRLNY